MNRRRTLPIITLLLIGMAAGSSYARLGGAPGAFSRMGFSARGIGMGNAMTAVTEGELVGYYNPAVLPFGTSRTVTAAFSILTLDRRLNFLSYSQPVHPSAGISAGVINSGVGAIDGRDADANPTGMLHTSENLFFLSFANRFQSRLTLGITLKLLYHHLYTDVSTTNVGIDFGGVFQLSDELRVGATVRDINAEYKWDSSELYGQSGNTTKEPFPLLTTVGASCRLPDSIGTVAADVEFSDRSTIIARIGAEVFLTPEVRVRAGLDRIDLKEKGNGVKPSIGFSIRRPIDSIIPALHYAFVLEPFASSGFHVIALSVTL